MTSTSYPKHRLYDKNEQLDINLHIGSLCVDAKVSSEYKILQEAYFADKFFNVGKSRFKLRQFLFAEYNKRGFIFIEQVKEGVSVILKEAALKNKADNTDNFLPMNQIFTCKCGWLLFNPSTLPCGHTMCKHCADENLFCIICGYAFDEPSNPNLFLVQLMVLWFPLEYQSSQHKLDAKTLLVSEDFELALNEIDTCISLVKNDYSAFQLRAEIYLKLEKYQSALSDATMSCTLNPNCGKSQFLRGSCFSQLGKLNDAIDAFQLCLELEPEDMALCNSVINKLDSILSLPDTGAALGNESSEEATISKKTETEKEPPEPSCSSHRTDQQKDVENGGPELETKVAKQTLEENSEIPDLLDTEIKKIHGVPKKLIKESDFECRLCFELLFMPITTSCGHIFCKSCLLRSLDHNVACPICRTSLAEFLRNTMKPVTKIVEDILKLFFNEEFNTRKQQHSNKMDRLSRLDLFLIKFVSRFLSRRKFRKSILYLYMQLNILNWITRLLRLCNTYSTYLFNYYELYIYFDILQKNVAFLIHILNVYACLLYTELAKMRALRFQYSFARSPFLT